MGDRLSESIRNGLGVYYRAVGVLMLLSLSSLESWGYC